MFKIQKQQILKKKDKSSKGDWDEKIVRLCKKINSSDNYYTTSSCSGRVVLLKDEKNERGGLFLKVYHNKVEFEDLKKDLREVRKKGEVKFKQEPCILHVACENVESANTLLKKAREIGWKRSGMISIDKKIVCELMSTEKLEFPVVEEGKILVDDDFLRLVVKKSNDNLEKVWEKMEKLRKLLT